MGPGLPEIGLPEIGLTGNGLPGSDLSGLEFAVKARQADTTGQPGFGIDLQLSQRQALVLQGDRGLSKKGEGSASYYYSLPGLDLTGTLQLPSGQVAVTGRAWLDREWSTSVLSEGLAGWDWFSLQLKDGRSVMAFRLRRYDGTRDDFDHGMVVAAGTPVNRVLGAGDPGVQVLSPADFELQPARYWQDERGSHWPVARWL